MAIRGIQEPVVYVHNPMPSVTDKEIAERAELDLMDFSEKKTPFDWHWTYNAGLDQEHIDVLPGDFYALRKSEAELFLRQFAELGAVLVDDPHDEAQVKKSAMKGLKKAHTFWSDRGNKRIIDFRKTHGIGREEMTDYTYDLWVYYRNQAIADRIQEEIREIEKSPKRSAAQKAEA